MQSHARSLVACALVGVFILCLPVLLSQSHYGSGPRVSPRNILQRGPSDREQLDDSAIGLVNGASQNNPELLTTTSWSIFSSSHSPSDPHALERRADGPLYCTDGPCIDGSCCGKSGICGYGPDFCGDGCTSQCNATAMCGQYSENGEMPCGMKLCCSATGWCGTTEVYCDNADPAHKTLPCQAGYGSCSITGPPSCPAGSGSSSKRKIGYYQSWNQRDRKCNKVAPNQLNTDGYTHLFFSFASIDPQSFRITPAHPDDVQGMKDFTALSKDGKLQTWIAVGGFDFSNPEAATHTTWSDMVSTKDNRAAFISSVKEYMDTYGFQGVDIDWEYPGAPERGGRKLDDTRNLSLLVKEMRAAYGTAYGISLTLAPDYWYLRWFDAKAMEANVDFFGFMAYDLHGSWDADVLALGSLVRGQADIREISKNTLPLWFDGLNPAKLNFGLAMYGRGYTLADPSCNQLLCPFSGPSKPAPCTSFNGVMSLVEIKQLIKQRGLEPQYLEEAMMKQITWDDQWIGYDDEDTFAAKMSFADSLCFGGTMVWSIDFQEVGSGGPDEEDGEVVYIGTEVYQQPTAQCEPPCIMVLPPSKLPSSTTISLPEYTTSLEVGSSTAVNGEATFVVTTTTITITLTSIVTDQYPMSNVHVTSQSGSSSIVAMPSVEVPPVSVVLTNGQGETSTRVLSLPPWPAITNGPVETGNGGTTSGEGGASSTITIPADEPYTKPAIVANCEQSILYVVEEKARITLQDCQGPTTMEWDCPPTKTIEIAAAADKSFSLGCTVWVGTGFQGVPTTTSTISGLPVYSTWPAGELVWVEDEPEDDDDDKKTTCKLWFFFICISWGDIKIGGWRWDFPPGILPPGPPPTIKFPPQMTIRGTLPGPWPRITIGANGVATYPENKPTDCTSSTADVCITTTSFSATVTGQTTRTATSVVSTCTPIVGCNVEDDDSTTSVTTIDSCTALTQLGRRAEATATASASERHELSARAGEACTKDDIIIYPVSIDDRSNPSVYTIESYLQELGYDGLLNTPNVKKLWEETEVAGIPEEYTAFFFVRDVPTFLIPIIREHIGDYIKDVYSIYDFNQRNNYLPQSASASVARRNSAFNESLELEKRADETNGYWELSQVCLPPNVDWEDSAELPDGPFLAYYDTSFGEGQTIYVVEDGFSDDEEFALTYNIGAETFNRPQVRMIDETLDYGQVHNGAALLKHGSDVLSKVWGKSFGLGKNAQIVMPKNTNGDPADRFYKIQDRYLESLIRVLGDVMAGYPANKGKVILNMSFGWLVDVHTWVHPAHFETLHEILTALDQHGVVIVAVTHNLNLDVRGRNRLDGWPSRYGDPSDNDYIPNLIVVSGSDKNGAVSRLNPSASWVIKAPGYQVHVAGGGVEDGASLAAPLVAGTIAYWRGLPGVRADWVEELKDPANVKKLLRFMQRPIKAQTIQVPDGTRSRVPTIWSGRVPDGDCLVNPKLKGCPIFTDKIADLAPFGAGDCGPGGSGIKRRQDGQGWTCVIGGGDGGNGGGNNGGSNPNGLTISYKPGPVSPTCNAGCGTRCSGYYCDPTPTGEPPGYYDPLDPSHVGTLTGLPTLSSQPTTTSCGPGEGTTTSLMCAGGNGHSACVTRQVCTSIQTVPTSLPDLPTLEPEDPPIPTNCAATSTWEQCGGPGGGGSKTACMTHSSCISTSVSTTKVTPTTTQQPTNPSPKVIYIMDTTFIKYPWYVFGTSPDTGLDPCNAEPFSKQGVAASIYPASLDAFSAFGIGGITYTGSESSPGTLKVPGYGDVKCAKDPDYGKIHHCDNQQNWYERRAKCTWT
ncbi:hypothetical protein PFICI_13167 [Pestalotiopsis fici W106-1]|uniref:chitinase n=1 Tax=Pestalotiopsis fici (strain W106-1 / CGMCC3.15140) TaxID=1229662 RepID=W3WLE2_PESFW|nr:uncharacterized protein PFICI_13167 [Pestalotiopsis fici W106-1]ETS74683.1 hypothetical protein PFICI_13167 [Pestalotiopsis fici W106-1]